MIDLEELERMAKAATPGKWHWEHWYHSVYQYYKPFVFTGKNDTPIAELNIGMWNGERNASYMVAACNAVPELIQRIRELEAEADILADRLSCHNPNCHCGIDVKHWRIWAREKLRKQSPDFGSHVIEK